jgi:hypothetical protein
MQSIISFLSIIAGAYVTPVVPVDLPGSDGGVSPGGPGGGAPAFCSFASPMPMGQYVKNRTSRTNICGRFLESSSNGVPGQPTEILGGFGYFTTLQASPVYKINSGNACPASGKCTDPTSLLTIPAFEENVKLSKTRSTKPTWNAAFDVLFNYLKSFTVGWSGDQSTTQECTIKVTFPPANVMAGKRRVTGWLAITRNGKDTAQGKEPRELSESWLEYFNEEGNYPAEYSACTGTWSDEECVRKIKDDQGNIIRIEPCIANAATD